MTLDDWIAREAFGVVLESADGFDVAVDRMVAALGEAVELLGLGEALHGSEDVLILRNRLFRRLVAAHGYTAIAIESSFPRGRLVDDYVAGRGPTSYEDVRERGFSHGFGRSEANRELVEWMRRHNAESPSGAGLRFYGFDSPTEMTGTDSPRQLMTVALDYLEAIDAAGGSQRRQRFEELLGNDADWENPAAMMEPAKSIGLSPAADALRIEAEELVTELELRRPEVTSDEDGPYLEALQRASAARQFLTYHAGLARASDDRLMRLLAIRDLMMAGNLAYAVGRERQRGGRLLAFAHNSHLKRGRATWQLGPHALSWWPAGAHAAATLGPRYAVIGTGVGVSEAHGIGPPEAGTLEARLAARAAGMARFIPTHRGTCLATPEVAALPNRSGSATNSTYFPLTAQSLTDFDALLILD